MYIRMNYTDSSILDITKSYISMINQFIDAFLQISFEPAATPSIEQYDCMLYIGINLIYRVYKYGLLKFKNIKQQNIIHKRLICFSLSIQNKSITMNLHSI